jgi:hypothetical protein
VKVDQIGNGWEMTGFERKDWKKIMVDIKELYEINQETQGFSSVSVAITDSKVNQSLGTNSLTTKDIQLAFDFLSPKMYKTELKIFFKRRKSDDDKYPLNGTITLKGDGQWLSKYCPEIKEGKT